ncbi:MFS transporter [Novosphingobium sp. KACC 22771]|uniref:MFS transporter n=1 Tax=Novosphingobium sp. KACC 22771 TaxID=3025670 RepID=UPI0023654C0B|nr:MFS transporter [Novosphingobium sp. KACC 22771]WDF75024.1 MFS transporter [Novosphingobium sp. KACC 22771]
MDHVSTIEGQANLGRHAERLGTAGLISAIVIGFVGALFVYATPGILGLIAAQSGVDDEHLGYIASWNLNAMAVAIAISTLLLTRLSWRMAMAMALLLIAAGDMATGLSHSYGAIAAARAISGLGEGMAIGFSFAALGRARNPDRAFAWYLVVSGIVAAVLLFALPALQARYAPSAIFMASVGLTALTALGIVAFPDGQRDEAHFDLSGRVDWRKTLFGLTAVLFVFFAISAVWSYAERIGHASGLGAQTVANGLSLGMVGGILGALAAAALPQGWGRVWPILIGGVIAIAGFELLNGHVGAAAFELGNFLIWGGWNFAQPLLSGLCADADSRGRVVCAMGAVQTFGMGLGPAVAAPTVAGGSFGVAITLASVTMLMGIGCVAAEQMLGRGSKA